MAMSDSAGLNIRVDSTSIPRAVTDLSQLEVQAGATEAAVSRIGNTTSSFDRRVGDLNREMQATDRAMRQAGGAIGTAAGEAKDFGTSIGLSNQMLEGMVGELGRLDPRLGQAVVSMQRFGIAAGAAFAAVAAGGATLGMAVSAARDLETDMFRLEAVIRATGGSAGMTAEQINEFANALDLQTLADAPAIREAAAKLMTFRSVSGETFREALTLSQDLAAVGFGSISQAATQLGKALEDPTVGLTALRRVGVSFNETQRDMIREMMEAGDVAGAQGLILEGVAQQVGGAGAGEAQGLAGQVDELAMAWRRLLEEIGESGPLQTVTMMVDGWGRAINHITDTLFPSLEQQLADAEGRLAAFREQSHFPARAILGPFVEGEEELEENVRRLREQVAIREIDAANAEMQAETVRKLAEAERVLGEEQEKAAKAAEKLKQEQERIGAARVKAGSDLEFEITNLEHLRDANRQGADAYREMTLAVETREALRALSLTAGSAEAEQLMQQYNLRNTLKETLDEEVAAREKLEDQRESEIEKRREALESLELEIDALTRLAQAREVGPAEVRKVSGQLEVDRFFARHDFGSASPEEQARAAALVERRELLEEAARTSVPELSVSEIGALVDEEIAGLRELEASIDPVVRRQTQLVEMEDKLNRARAMGVISAQRQTELMGQYAQSLQPVSPLIRDLEQTGANAFQNLEDALVDLTSGVGDFGDAFTNLVTGMLKDIQRLAIRETITRPLLEAFGLMLRSQSMMGGGMGGGAGGLDVFGGVASTLVTGALVGGMSGGIAGGVTGSVRAPTGAALTQPWWVGAQHGMDWMVPGGSGSDTVPLPLMVSPGERVRVETPQQQRMARQGGSVTMVGSMNISAPNAAPGIEQRIRREVVAGLRQVRSEMVPSLVDALDRDADLAASVGA